MLYFSDWLADVGEQRAFEHLPEAELDSLLCRFYAGLAPAGESVDYSKSSYVNIRAGLNRYLRSPPTQRKINLMHDKEFMESIQVFSGLLKTMRRAGLDKTTHKTPISAGDMDRLYASGVLSNDTPWGLIYKVYFELSLHFSRRGVEGIRELHKSSFVFETDDMGATYCRMAYNEMEKKKQGNEKTIREKEARMYEEPGDDCPIRSLKLLLAKLHPDCKALFQYPRGTVKITDKVWFNRQPIGKNTICQLMKRISEAAELSRTYTNHCIRATSITAMNAAGIEGTNIISITGHKSVDSLKPYLNGPSEEQKRDISKKLHQAKRPHACTTVVNSDSSASSCVVSPNHMSQTIEFQLPPVDMPHEMPNPYTPASPRPRVSENGVGLPAPYAPRSGIPRQSLPTQHHLSLATPQHGMPAPNNPMSVIPPGIPAFLNGANIYGNINMSFNTYSCNQTHLWTPDKTHKWIHIPCYWYFVTKICGK